MTDLKTLKDLDLGTCCDLCGEYNVKLLKAEAVKWFNELVKYREYETPENIWSAKIGGLIVNWTPYECYEPIEMAKWIRYFFNLTEEDLK